MNRVWGSGGLGGGGAGDHVTVLLSFFVTIAVSVAVSHPPSHPPANRASQWAGKGGGQGGPLGPQICSLGGVFALRVPCARHACYFDYHFSKFSPQVHHYPMNPRDGGCDDGRVGERPRTRLPSTRGSK